MKTVRDVVRRYLTKNGYDGLCGAFCACSTEDLMPCEDGCGGCELAKRYYCPLCRETVYVPADEKQPRCTECGSVLERQGK